MAYQALFDRRVVNSTFTLLDTEWPALTKSRTPDVSLWGKSEVDKK